MFGNTIINSILAVILTVLVCFVISTLLPGIERKYIHARIQQRIGPPVTSPGIMAPLKFLYNVFPSASYGWFTINWFYTIVLFTFFVGVFILLYFVSKLIVSLIEKQ